MFCINCEGANYRYLLKLFLYLLLPLDLMFNKCEKKNICIYSYTYKNDLYKKKCIYYIHIEIFQPRLLYEISF